MDARALVVCGELLIRVYLYSDLSVPTVHFATRSKARADVGGRRTIS